MAVSNGQVANATTFNNAFLSRTQDSSTVGRVSLQNTDPASGGSITNIQREANKVNSFLGSTANDVFDALPAWTNNEVGSSTDNVKQRADNLTERFNGITGHTHSGVNGEGPAVSAGDLSDFNNFFAELQTDVFASAVGLNDDVTSVFSAKTPGGGTAAVGIPTTSPYNRVELFVDPSGDEIEEPSGRQVYGRLTESAGTWTLTYFYQDTAGAEQPYSLPSQNIRLYWREVFDASTRPTFGTQATIVGSLDTTRDVVDASGTQSGKVNTSAQSFAGLKTFLNGGVFDEAISLTRLDVASGGTVTALSSAKSFLKLTGASTTDLQGILAPSTAKLLLLYNDSSGDLTVRNENAGALAANRIITSDGSDLTIGENESVLFIYDLGVSRWLVASTGGGGGGSTVQGYQEALGTGDGSTTSFGPLAFTPIDEDSIEVFVDGIIQDKAGWSLSVADIVFSTAPASAQDVYVWYLTNGVAIPLTPSATQEVEYRTLTGGEATAKSLTLIATPMSASKVVVDIIGGTAQEYSVDYTVSGTTLSWSGLGLDGLLSSGDKLRIMYLS